MTTRAELIASREAKLIWDDRIRDHEPERLHDAETHVTGLEFAAMMQRQTCLACHAQVTFYGRGLRVTVTYVREENRRGWTPPPRCAAANIPLALICRSRGSRVGDLARAVAEILEGVALTANCSFCGQLVHCSVWTEEGFPSWESSRLGSWNPFAPPMHFSEAATA